MNTRIVLRNVLHYAATAASATVILATLLSACAPATPSSTPREATLEALAERISLTATAAMKNDDAAAPVATVVVKATQAAQAQEVVKATQTSQDNEAVKATQAAELPIRSELPAYGVDPAKGSVAWIHPPFTLDVQGYNDVKAHNDFPGVVVKDFVMSANITWNTQYGDSGCGFVVRSDGNQNNGSQYLIGLTRVANGHIGFAVIANGEIVNLIDLYPKSNDRGFSAENDATNQLTVVGRGTKFSIYTNHTLIGEVDPNTPPVMQKLPDAPAQPPKPVDPKLKSTYDANKAIYDQEVAKIKAEFAHRKQLFERSNKEFPQGFVTMVAITNAGKATCTFNNAWLWLIEE